MATNLKYPPKNLNLPPNFYLRKFYWDFFIIFLIDSENLGNYDLSTGIVKFCSWPKSFFGGINKCHPFKIQTFILH